MFVSHKPAFTLIELLVVIAIISILATIGLASFQTARLKARDATRKSDLQTISKSLEAYVNDYQSFPISSSGKIVCQPPATICAYGAPFQDSKATIYVAKLPSDPVMDQTYYYESDGTKFTLYAHLENSQDSSIDNTIVTSCGSQTCNYQLKSTNQL